LIYAVPWHSKSKAPDQRGLGATDRSGTRRRDIRHSLLWSFIAAVALQLFPFHAIAQSGFVWGYDTDSSVKTRGTAADVCTADNFQFASPPTFEVFTPTPGTNSLPLSASDVGKCDLTVTIFKLGEWVTSLIPHDAGLRVYGTTTPYWLDINIPRPQVCTKNCLGRSDQPRDRERLPNRRRRQVRQRFGI
jgi:hypothetical protein